MWPRAEPTWIPSNKGRLGNLGSFTGLIRSRALSMKAFISSFCL